VFPTECSPFLHVFSEILGIKSGVLFQFIIYPFWTPVRTPCTGDRPFTRDSAQHRKTRTHWDSNPQSHSCDHCCRRRFFILTMNSSGAVSPREEKRFLCLVAGHVAWTRIGRVVCVCVQTSSEAHPASCPVGNGVVYRGLKNRHGRDADHSPPSSAGVKNELDLHLGAFMA
jgi:hypothetical protein